jgi:hypothetical protein
MARRRSPASRGDSECLASCRRPGFERFFANREVRAEMDRIVEALRS